MANTVNLTSTNSNLNVGGIVGGLTTFDTNLNVTYGAAGGINNVTGSVDVAALGVVVPGSNITSFTGSYNKATNTYTITGENTVLGEGEYITITYVGETPSSFASVSYGLVIAGVQSPPLATATPNADPVTSNPCFAEGTLIRTLHGDVAVEHLTVGDIVVTALGERRPIKWLGHRVTHPSRHPRPYEVMPICIAANAFGEGKPFTALTVSPGHSLGVDLVGEVLIPAGLLVNGSTVQQLEVDEVTYWHVELDSHDVILANGMPAESYLEMSNRDFFGDAGVISLDAGPDPVMVTHANFCRPFVDHGPLLDAVRIQMRRRAETLGWTLAEAPLADLHLDVDGKRISPTVRGLIARFEVPASASSLTLVSRTIRPCDVGSTDDMRPLGVCLKSLAIDDGFGETECIAIDDPRLEDGVCDVEGDSRWTTGRTPLPGELATARPDGFFLRVELARPALSHWVSPTASRGAEAPVKPVKLAIVA